MKYEIYQSGYSLTIQPQTYYHNCSVFEGTKSECEQRLRLIRSLPHQLGETVDGDLITSLRVVGPVVDSYIVTYYGYKSKSPILGSETLFQLVVENK